ncbi:hypothetical protein CY35_14G014300 [Sphagnum magellanicum]|nr:hypothetical protein CY35_14G014300 [Sphagnum magellanicum]
MAVTNDALAGAHSRSLLILVMCLVVVAAVTTPSDYSPSVNPPATSTPKPDDQTRVDSRDVATSTPKPDGDTFTNYGSTPKPDEADEFTTYGSTPKPDGDTFTNYGSTPKPDEADEFTTYGSTPKPEGDTFTNYGSTPKPDEDGQEKNRNADMHPKEDLENVPDFQMLGVFLESKLVKGSTMDLGANFLYDAANSRRDFLPGAVADTLPALKASNLPKLLQAFNIREGTEMARSMERTISSCEGIANLTPEEKPASCPTSEKAMGKFVTSLLGQNVELLTSKVISAKASAVSGPVTVVDYHTRSADIKDTPVVCHSLSFPSQVYYCHKLSKTRVLQATLEAAEGGRINAVAICHLDTSFWSSKHPAFAALNVKPGTEVCHWTVESTLVWVRNSNT